MNYHVEFGDGRGQWDDFHCNWTFPAACKQHLLPYLTGDGAMKEKSSHWETGIPRSLECNFPINMFVQSSKFLIVMTRVQLLRESADEIWAGVAPAQVLYRPLTLRLLPLCAARLSDLDPGQPRGRGPQRKLRLSLYSPQ